MRPGRDWRMALQRLEGAYADKTLRGYASDFDIFERWCGAAGFAALPATAATVALFVEAQIGTVAPRTVTRRLAAIGRIHQLAALPDFSRDAEVALALRRGLRQYGRRPRQALGLSAALRDQLIEACPASLKGLRDRAVIAVGYDTLCRRSELAALRLEDLQVLAAGGAKVLVRQSKTDPFQDGGFGFISARGLVLLRAWISASGLESGPMFRPVFISSVGKKAIHPRTINRILQDCAALAGCPASVVSRLSAHSLRVGPAQDLAISGRTALQIMRAGRWRHADAISAYIRAADINVWGETPTV